MHPKFQVQVSLSSGLLSHVTSEARSSHEDQRTYYYWAEKERLALSYHLSLPELQATPTSC
jgi:hypothetical protein